ncbi:MAG TPA: alpha-amylase family glycosyl hydrolase [Bacteroidota bacterium]|nr:alpha-amylase family glycosyl hydrolase [Bacteroidota bacterium]
MQALTRLSMVGCVIVFFLGCIKEHPHANWVRGAVIEQIDLRSYPYAKTFTEFAACLPELKAHGITAVDLMPIYSIGEFNRSSAAGTLTSIRDYYDVNNEFGTLSDFQLLVRTAHRYNIKILVDFVAAYTSWDCNILMEHPDWYIRNDDDYIISPKAERTDVAALNLHHHEAKKYVIAAMEYWLTSADIDGYRCIDARMVPKKFWEIARAQLEQIKPVMLVSDSTMFSCVAFDTVLSGK